MRTSILLLCCAFSVLLSIAQDEDTFTMKLYPVSAMLFAETIAPATSYGDPYGGADPFGGGADPFAAATNAAAKAKPYDPVDDLADMAELPKGSTLKYSPQFSRLMVRTSPEGHRRFKDVLAELDVPPVRISVDFSFIEIPTNVVATSEVFQQSGSLDTTEVLRLFREGKARLLSMTKATTLSGVNTQIESAQEIIFPTEFQPKPAAKGAAPGQVVATPGEFETREVGHILNVTPTISSVDPKAIYLALLPESAILTGWIDFETKGNDKIKPERHGLTPQPVFRSLNFTGSLFMNDGETVVAFGGPDPDTGNPIYGLVTARIETPK